MMKSLIPKISRYRRIVVVGPRHSGKSVLLSSLLDHLRKGPDQFLGTNENWWRYHLESYPADFPEFPLDRILREASEEALWPEITTSPSAVRFRAEHPKAWKRDLVLDFVDFPGENIADFLGAGNFRSWSNAIANLFPNRLDPQSEEALRLYRASLSTARTNSQIDDLASLYSKLMIEATRRGRYLTSPASLCSEIFKAKESNTEDLFGPLPENWEGSSGPAYPIFEKRFNQYYEKNTLSLEHLLAEADALVLPIDVGWILSGGAPLLKDQFALLDSLGEMLSRIDTVWNRVASFLGRSFTPIDDSKFPGRLRSIVLCATKIDQFRPSDRSNLEHLVRKLAEPVIRGAGLHSIQILFTSCSAIRSSTDSVSNPDHLKGFKNGEPVEFLPPKLPPEWPNQWSPNDFRFTRLDPRVSPHGLYPPSHIHLDRILRSILES